MLGSEVVLCFEGVMAAAEPRHVRGGRFAAACKRVSMMQLESASLLTAAARPVDERAATSISFRYLSPYLPRDIASSWFPRLRSSLFTTRLCKALFFEDLDQLVARALHDESDVPARAGARAHWAEQFLRPPKLIPQLGARGELNFEAVLPEGRNDPAVASRRRRGRRL